MLRADDDLYKMRTEMESITSIVDLLAIITVIVAVTRNVWSGAARSAGSAVLTVCIAAAAVVFGTVSVSAATGLAQGASSTQGILLAAVLVTAAIAVVCWSTPKRQKRDETPNSKLENSVV